MFWRTVAIEVCYRKGQAAKNDISLFLQECVAEYALDLAQNVAQNLVPDLARIWPRLVIFRIIPQVLALPSCSGFGPDVAPDAV